MGNFTVQLVDDLYGRIVLDQVSAPNAAGAHTLALAARVVSGDHGNVYSAGGTIDQKVAISVTGTDAAGDQVVGPDSLPTVLEIVDPFGRG